MQKEYILKPSLINSGYYVVTLYATNKRKRKFQIHRLVADAFICNNNNFPCVNHKDENKLNNCVENLEWCTYQYNNNYGTARIRSINTQARTVNQITLDNVLIAKYFSVSIASELLGYPNNLLAKWCREGIGGGYKWSYDEEKL